MKLSICNTICSVKDMEAESFSISEYVHGGGDIAIQSILSHLLFNGALAYSGGRSYGNPVIHIGPVALDSDLNAYQELFHTYGERFAQQAQKLF